MLLMLWIYFVDVREENECDVKFFYQKKHPSNGINPCESLSSLWVLRCIPWSSSMLGVYVTYISPLLLGMSLSASHMYLCIKKR